MWWHYEVVGCVCDVDINPNKLMETTPLNSVVFPIRHKHRRDRPKRNTRISLLYRMRGPLSPFNNVGGLEHVHALVNSISQQLSYGVIISQNIG
jgi:hypothetical protein